MNRRILWLILMLLFIGLLASACEGEEQAGSILEETTGITGEMDVEPVNEVAEEPVQESVPKLVDEVQAASEAELDTAFASFLSKMVTYNTISLESLNELLISGPPHLLLDVRQPAELDENGHIEGAINIPLRELGQHLVLLPGFDAPIVSYCGIGWRCTIAMTELGALGWENVLSLKGGSFGGWVEAGYPTVEGPAAEPLALQAAEPEMGLVTVVGQTLATIPEDWGVITADQLNTELIENPDLILIDVRRLEEVQESGVVESENYIYIPVEEFIAQKALWPASKDLPIVIYCSNDHRSTMAMSILWTYGYTDVRSLKDGLAEWVTSGYPTVAFETVQ